MTELPNPFLVAGDQPSPSKTPAAALTPDTTTAAAGRFQLDEAKFVAELADELAGLDVPSFLSAPSPGYLAIVETLAGR